MSIAGLFTKTPSGASQGAKMVILNGGVGSGVKGHTHAQYELQEHFQPKHRDQPGWHGIAQIKSANIEEVENPVSVARLATHGRKMVRISGTEHTPMANGGAGSGIHGHQTFRGRIDAIKARIEAQGTPYKRDMKWGSKDFGGPFSSLFRGKRLGRVRLEGGKLKWKGPDGNMNEDDFK